MSHLPADHLKKSITKMLTQRKQRKFVETVELQIGLRDINKEKKISGNVKLPNAPYNKLKVCIIGSAAHCEEAKKIGVSFIDVEGLKVFNKDKKKIKKWAKPYDCLLASDSLMKNVISLTGKILPKIGKFPTAINENEKIASKVEELKHTVKFTINLTCLGTAIGNVNHSEEQIRQNIVMALNFLVSILPKGWLNIRTVHIKTSMSPSIKILG